MQRRQSPPGSSLRGACQYSLTPVLTSITTDNEYGSQIGPDYKSYVKAFGNPALKKYPLVTIIILVETFAN
jgi:hypothetical protein